MRFIRCKIKTTAYEHRGTPREQLQNSQFSYSADDLPTKENYLLSAKYTQGSQALSQFSPTPETKNFENHPTATTNRSDA